MTTSLFFDPKTALSDSIETPTLRSKDTRVELSDGDISLIRYLLRTNEPLRLRPTPSPVASCENSDDEGDGDDDGSYYDAVDAMYMTQSCPFLTESEVMECVHTLSESGHVLPLEEDSCEVVDHSNKDLGVEPWILVEEAADTKGIVDVDGEEPEDDGAARLS